MALAPGEVRKDLSADSLFRVLRSHFGSLPDPRSAEVEIPLDDALMSAFAMFSLKDPSLLAFDHRRRDPKDNFRTIYGIHRVPCDSQMRAVLDPVDPASLRPPFRAVFRRLQRGKVLKRFAYLDDHYLLSLDGTTYFSSATIHCPSCLVNHHRGGRVTYSHQLLGATLVHPDLKEVIPLAPEPIIQQDGQTKNDHFRAMLAVAQGRGFAPECVVFDSWYSGLENLKAIRNLGWRWLTQLKENRNVNLDRQGLKPVSRTAIAAGGTVVHLEGYGLIRVFKIVSRDGDIGYWATGDLAMDELERLRLAEWCWAIEDYHRGLKQCCGVERSQARAARAQRNHIGLAIRAFLRLERHFYVTGISWYEAKARIIRGAVRAYIAHPLYGLT